ncbi:MAG: hypothetical protein Q4C95_03510 [Planctomycetia bacterium]|nr:hypothetical protein [Planctomycetia bacterium]
MAITQEPSEKLIVNPVKERFVGCWQLPEFLLWGGIFSLGVLILVIHLMTWGVALWKESNRLVETDCVVKECFLHAKPDRNGNLFYRPEIRIEYVVDGETFSMFAYDRQTLTEDQGFLYSRQEVLDLLANYSPEMKTICWFDSTDPKKVILQKKSLFWGWLFLMIPLTLLVYAGTCLTLRYRFRSQSLEQRTLIQQRKCLYPTLPNEQEINESPGVRLTFRLPVIFVPLFPLICALCLAILWNLLAWILFIYLFSSSQNGWDTGLAFLFGIIFCGAGFAFIPWIIKRIRTALHFGSTILEISDHPILPGRKLRLTLIQDGWIETQMYRISIVCEELARYRQGTDTITNKKEVYRQELWRKESLTIQRGETISEDFFLQLPIGAMHSFEVENNMIHWQIVIEMEKNGNRFQRECPVIVFPLCCPE